MSFYKEVPGLEKTLESTLKFDIEPKVGSTNPVTSDGVKTAIDDSVGDAAEAIQEQIDAISDRAGSGYTPKGEASVATLNGLSGQENGWLYTITDAGTLTDGSLAVVAGDTVAWDATNEVWYKAMDYAPRQYGTNEVHNLPTSITAFRTGDVIPVDGPDGTAKMGKDDLLKATAENIVNDLDASATSAFLPYGKTFALKKSDLIGLKNGYVESDGTISSSLQHKYCEIPLCGVKNVKVTLPGGGLSSLYAIVMKKSDDTFVYGGSLNVSTEQVVSVSPQIGGTLYLNFFSSLGNITFYVEYYKSDEVFGAPASNADFESLIIPSRIAYGRKITIDPALADGFENGIIKDDGSLSTGHGRKHVTIPMHGVKSIKIKNAAGGSIGGFSHVVLEFPNSQYRAYCPAANSGDLVSGKIMLDWLGKIHLNYYSQSASIGATWEIEYFSEEEMQTHDDQKRRLVNLVRKPLNLGSSDKAMFAGSSVMRGFTSGSTTTSYNLPYWVNEKFNFASFVNVAVASSTIANVTGYTQLISQLSGLDTSYTLLVIYAGQNDYALGVNVTDFRNAVKDLCDYINANASNTCKVVFITPIDDGGYHMYDNTRYTANDEDDYRYIIQEEMMKNDTYARFNIVQGRDFGFPSMASSASAISTFFGDRLHPTELGYKTLMANGFLNAIG